MHSGPHRDRGRRSAEAYRNSAVQKNDQREEHVYISIYNYIQYLYSIRFKDHSMALPPPPCLISVVYNEQGCPP